MRFEFFYRVEPKGAATDAFFYFRKSSWASPPRERGTDHRPPRIVYHSAGLSSIYNTVSSIFFLISSSNYLIMIDTGGKL